MTLDNVKAGDMVVYHSGWMSVPDEICPVTQVTPARIWIERNGSKVPFSCKGKRVGDRGFHVATIEPASLEEAQRISRYKEENALRVRASNIDAFNLPIEKVRRIVEILNEKP